MEFSALTDVARQTKQYNKHKTFKCASLLCLPLLTKGSLWFVNISIVYHCGVLFVTQSTALKHWPDLLVFPMNCCFGYFFYRKSLMSKVKTQVQYDLLPQTSFLKLFVTLTFNWNNENLCVLCLFLLLLWFPHYKSFVLQASYCTPALRAFV